MFSIILPGRPCLTDLATLSATQFAFTFPSTPTFSHLVIFILPGNVLPPDTAAAVYLQLPNIPNFKLLGAIGNEKQSAIFKVNLPAMEASDLAGSPVTVGISIEPVAVIQSQLTALEADKGTASTALVRRPPGTKVLAQRIIKNAFNFLASFAGGGPGGSEVVPLKSFQDWWVKFERRIEVDPGFLERDEND